MPELPEVETIVRQLRDVVVGKRIKKIEILRARSFSGDKNELTDKKIKGIDRRSKVIRICFADWEKSLIIHLKMTGQLVYVEKPKNQKTKESKRIAGGHPSEDWIDELPNKHTRVVFDLDDGSKLFFNDLRVFGWVKVIDNGELTIQNGKLPPDVVDKGFSQIYFEGLLKTKKPVKLLILDQQKIGGMGNIYANDALFASGIEPKRESGSLNKDEIKKLYEAMKMVIKKGIETGGASAANYVQVTGKGGKYQDHFLVYKRDGQECHKCKSIIRKYKLGGRGTYFCPKCQS